MKNIFKKTKKLSVTLLGKYLSHEGTTRNVFVITEDVNSILAYIG
jgi:hypothetical protein